MVNYFELYGIAESFNPDAAIVKKKYYELSRQYHPDRFATADDSTRAEALRMAALNNDAFKMLNNPDATTAYILKQHQLLEDEEKYNLPPAFLMEMMDLNEVISDWEMEPDNDILRQTATDTLAEQLEQWQQEVTPLTQQYNSGNHDKQLLLRIKDYYFRKKYLLRIQERIDTFASR
ncbi:iron-sulfur cluster co-chaperone HscB C-terminal domain-containing protein [Polluticoccus soli]|uniref:iron-sulfur cluster co-chaperone HscB C-terminal domain-containing protein n=1 Tax=Polluticoccus soli TaxID=3034150 RepID=UPI0023E0DAC6|nr:iron-sulfur cluster co-chaperone HscB C-terminal domain-containing protein [Flavipsychrobacter sp. JY13-12]